MLLGTLLEDDAVPLLSHEETEREAEAAINQRVAEPLRRLLCVAHLEKVAPLEGGKGGRDGGMKGREEREGRGGGEGGREGREKKRGESLS